MQIKLLKRTIGHFISIIVFIVSGNYYKNRNQIRKLKNSCAGKRCFIICNGPSLCAKDLTKIFDHQDISIGMNAIPKIYKKTPWRPTFLSVTDDIVFDNKNRKLIEESIESIKIYDAMRFLKSKNSKGRKIYLWFNESKKLLDFPQFSSNALKRIPSIGTSAFSVAEFAVYLGCKEIYLLGCDMSYAVNLKRDGTIVYNISGKEHFYEKKEDAHITSEVKPNPTWQLEIAFEFLANYAKENKINIYNATRGGELEFFPRVQFDELFESDGEQ